MKRIIILTMLASTILLTGCVRDHTVNKHEILFEIHNNDNIHKIAKNLAKKRIIRNSTRFKVYAKMNNKEKQIKSGMYLIGPEETYDSLLDKLTSGDEYEYKVVIPKGKNIYELAEILGKKKFIDKDKFITECSNTEHLNVYGITNFDTVEGFVYPDVYYFYLGVNEKKIIETAIDNFFSKMKDGIGNEISIKKLNFLDVLIEASIIEKESLNEYDKPIISGVIYNRISKDMPINCASSINYLKYSMNVKSVDSDIKSPYNTIKYKGFPKTPISNPNRTSLLSAVYPALHNYYYYTPDKNDRLYFITTYEEYKTVKEKYGN